MSEDYVWSKMCIMLLKYVGLLPGITKLNSNKIVEAPMVEPPLIIHPVTKAN